MSNPSASPNYSNSEDNVNVNVDANVDANTVENNLEPFNNLNGNIINTDLLLKSVMYGVIVYLLSLPEVHKMIAKVCCGMNIKLNMTHYPSYIVGAVIFAVIYFLVNQIA